MGEHPFQTALGLSPPWIVLRSEFDRDQKQLDLHIGFARGSRFGCPACGAEGCGVHDVREKEWRHLNFFQHKTVLKASIPRVSCDKCGVKQVSPPWARTGSGFTLLFEAFCFRWSRRCRWRMWPRSSTSTTRAYGECSIITFRGRLKGSISARSSRSRRYSNPIPSAARGEVRTCGQYRLSYLGDAQKLSLHV